MNTRSVLSIPLRVTGALAVAFALFLVGTASPKSLRPLQSQQGLPNNMIPDVKCVLGLENMSPGTVGTFTVIPAGIQFTADNKKAEIATTPSPIYSPARKAARTSAAWSAPA